MSERKQSVITKPQSLLDQQQLLPPPNLQTPTKPTNTRTRLKQKRHKIKDPSIQL